MKLIFTILKFDASLGKTLLRAPAYRQAGEEPPLTPPLKIRGRFMAHSATAFLCGPLGIFVLRRPSLGHCE
jgi:hypothetical protein